MGPKPNLFSLEAIIANFSIIKVEILLKNNLLTLVNELNYNVLIGVLNIKDDSFVPNWLHADAHICLSKRLVLVNFYCVGAFL